MNTKTLNSHNISSFLTSILTPSIFTAAKWAFLQRPNVTAAKLVRQNGQRRNGSGEVSISRKKTFRKKSDPITTLSSLPLWLEWRDKPPLGIGTQGGLPRGWGAGMMHGWKGGIIPPLGIGARGASPAGEAQGWCVQLIGQ